MIPYWFFFAVPVILFMASFRFDESLRKVSWYILAVFFILVVGLRYEVGGDWDSYLMHLLRMSHMDFHSALLGSDPGYYAVNWIVAALGGGIVWVNVVCAIVFVVGLFRFSARQPLPWLGLVVAVPYLVIVVAMGYTRQAAALGFLMIGLVNLQDGRMRRFIFWVAVGALFHKSAVLMLPVAALASSERRFWNFFWVGVVSLFVAYFLIFDAADELWSNYVVANYESQGGLIRVLMNAVPASLFLIFRKKINFVTDEECRLWTWISLLSILCIPLVILSSTATDRVALYLIPIQIYVFSRLHTVASDHYHRAFIVIAIITYYAAVQLVWLNFASHAHDWLPYKMYPFAQ